MDGQITEIRYVKDLPREGKLTWKFPEGKKDVILYLPADATVLIRNCEIDGAYTPAKKNEKVLWLGDSITQGFGPLRSAQTYVSVANRLLNYDIINQGIGGYVYDKKSLMKMERIYAGQDHRGAWNKPVRLRNHEGRGRILRDPDRYLRDEDPDPVHLPAVARRRSGRLPELDPFLRERAEIAAQYPNVTVVDGFKLVPHLPEYFLDNLHPNELGAETYGRNLVEEIRRTGF